MHELAVTQNILEIALQTAQNAKAKRVCAIELVIGEYSSFVDDSIQFYWEMIAKDTIAEKAVLHFKRIPAEMNCLTCGIDFHPTEETFECPSCQGHSVKITRGVELRVEGIDIE